MDAYECVCSFCLMIHKTGILRIDLDAELEISSRHSNGKPDIIIDMEEELVEMFTP